MDYKEKYEQALERAKELWEQGIMTERIEYIFPELKKSIKEEIIDFLRLPYHQFAGKRDHEKWIAWLEKQGENEPTDKVEPKFKVGDWIVTDDSFGKIVRHVDEISSNIIDERYVVSDEYGLTYNISFDKEHKWHKWTIQDAENGDVLVNGSNIFIFRYINHTRLMGYCHVNIDDGRFYDDTGKNECFCLIDAEVTPATKEQRDQLFQKMKEAGYEWDSEKKELKNIEVASKESEDESIRLEIRNFIWGYPDKLPERDKWLAWFEKQADKDKLIRDLGEYKVKYTQKVLQEDLNKIKSQSQPNFKVGDKVTIKGDNTVYTIGIIAPDKTCWLKHGSREYGWATFGILKHYAE